LRLLGLFFLAWFFGRRCLGCFILLRLLWGLFFWLLLGFFAGFSGLISFFRRFGFGF
jgi:hypothetical protein